MTTESYFLDTNERQEMEKDLLKYITRENVEDMCDTELSNLHKYYYPKKDLQ